MNLFKKSFEKKAQKMSSLFFSRFMNVNNNVHSENCILLRYSCKCELTIYAEITL